MRTNSRFQRIVDGTFDRVANRYERLVRGSLKFRPVTLLVVAVLSFIVHIWRRIRPFVDYPQPPAPKAT